MNLELDPAAGTLPHENFRCGTVALAGRPNVGKSTLLNALIGFRLSIVSPRPQTTRHRILGINTSEAGQILYVDTPGLHRGAKRAMNRSLNRAARSAISDVDVAVQVIEAGRWTDEDEAVYAALGEQSTPRLLVINKVDLNKDKTRDAAVRGQAGRRAQLRRDPLRQRAEEAGPEGAGAGDPRRACRCSRRCTARTRSPIAASVSLPRRWCASS